MKTSRKKPPGNNRAGYLTMQRQLPLILPAILPVIITLSTGLTGCTPSVKVEPPDEPITINLNVKIEHEIRVKVDKELDDVFSEDSGLF
jgi:hypothetical protein